MMLRMSRRHTNESSLLLQSNPRAVTCLCQASHNRHKHVTMSSGHHSGSHISLRVSALLRRRAGKGIRALVRDAGGRRSKTAAVIRIRRAACGPLIQNHRHLRRHSLQRHLLRRNPQRLLLVHGRGDKGAKGRRLALLLTNGQDGWSWQQPKRESRVWL
jgi:hypothetical protein